MATFNNDLRLKEIVTGDESGTWGDSTNANLGLVADAFSLGTKQMAADADESFTMPDAVADGTRSLFLKITSAVSLTVTRTVTLLPNTVSKVWIIENATTGSEIITIAQGSGATINVPSGSKVMVVTDGAGAGAAVFNANPTTTAGTVTSVGGTGTVNGISLSGTVTSSGNLTLGGTLSNVSLTTQVTGTLPVTNGGTGATTLNANNVVIGNGTSAVNFVAPSTSGNVLTSNGTTWISAVLPAGGLTYVVKTANYTTQDKEGVLADTTGGAFTVTLPADPDLGAQVVVADSGGVWGTNNLTIGRNGETIGDLAEDLVCDISSVSVQLVYDGSTWEVYAQIGGNGGTAVTLTGTQTLTNKTIDGASNTLSVRLANDVTGTLPTVNGGTGLATLGTAGQALVVNSGATALEFASVESVVQYPQNSQSADHTLVLSDAGKQIFHPAADDNVRTFTIPANSSVAFPIGTVVLFTAENGGRPVGVEITTDTLVFGAGTTGSLAVLPNNTLLCIKVTATKWMANYLYQAGIASQLQAIAVAHDSSPFITAYPFSGSAGFGTKFTNPATLPASTGNGVAFSPAGDAIAVAHGITPFISAYPFSASGFGTKFTNPATLPASTGRGVAFTPAGDAIAVAHATSPFVSAYPFSASGFGTKFTNPATLPTGTGNGVAFTPAGDAIAVAHDSSPFITAYPFSGSGFGTKFTNPATLPAGSGNGVAFSPAGDAIAVAHGTSPFVSAYPFSGSGFGTKFTNPATLPTGSGRGVAFTPAGDAIAVAHSSSPFITAYPFSGSGFGTKFTDPASLPPGTSTGVAFSPIGDAIAVSNGSTPFITGYPWSSVTGFGTKFTNPATLPTDTGRGVAFNLNP